MLRSESRLFVKSEKRKEKKSNAYCSTLLETSFDNVVLAAVGQQVEQFIH